MRCWEPIAASRQALATWVATAALLLGGCATNPVTGQSDLVLMTEREEIELGARYHEQILQEYAVYESPQLQAYVDELGQRLAAASHRRELAFTFTVLDSPEVNAFALPGGYVYLTRGILAHLGSEAELAGVIGHEIGHVTARHSVRQHAQSTLTGLFGGLSAQLGFGAGQLVNSLGTALVRGYGRDHELEADRLGAEYLARVGYDPEQMIEVVGVLKNQEAYERRRAEAEGREPRTYHGLFATHPDNDKRLKEVVRAAARLEGSASLPANREAYLRRIDGMVYGDSPRLGVVRDGNFYYPDLGVGLRAPAGWRIENGSQAVLFFPPPQDALVQLSLRTGSDPGDPRGALRAMLKDRELREERELRGEGLHGWRALADGKSPFGERPLQLALWLHGDQAWLFAAATREAGSYQAELDGLIASFHRLSPAERQRARPLRIELRRAAPGSSYARLAADSPLERDPEGTLRLLNDQLDPSAEPRPGEWIKVVR